MAETPQDSLNLCISVATRNETSLQNYVNFISYDEYGTETSNINIYVGGVYNITYYDSDNQTFVTNKYVHVTAVNSSYIKGEYIADNCPQVCLCANRKDLYNYITKNNVTILLSNISTIKDMSIKTIEDVCKEVTKVSILGISSEFIRSVIIRLRIYNDDVNTEVTTIDMEVGKKYNLQYFDHHDHTMYEVEGRLTHIAIDKNYGDEPEQHGFVRPECPTENPEVVGMGNNLYYTNEHFMKLPKDCPEKIVFIFDTSKTNESTYDYVRLTDIRDIYEVQEEIPDDGDDDTTDDTTCKCDTCPYKNASEVKPRPPFGFPPPPPPHHHHHHSHRPPHPPAMTFEVNDMTNCTVTPNYFVFTDKEGNELDKVKIEDVAKDYAEDKY